MSFSHRVTHLVLPCSLPHLELEETGDILSVFVTWWALGSHRLPLLLDKNPYMEKPFDLQTSPLGWAGNISCSPAGALRREIQLLEHGTLNQLLL